MATNEFFDLIPKIVISKNPKTATNSKPFQKLIGEFPLKKEDCIDNSKSWRFTLNATSVKKLYTIDFSSKSWQHKAWRVIGDRINWKTEPAFKDSKRVSKKMKHAIAIGVSMKIKAERPLEGATTTGKVMLDQIIKDPSAGNYFVASTALEIRELFNTMYYMMYIRSKDYIKQLDSMHYGIANYVFKAMVVYDDKSIDTFTGNPINMFKALDIEFDKNGHVFLS